MNYSYISWPKLHRLAFQLAKKIKKSDAQHDLIVAVARGGLVIGQMLSDFLALPIVSIAVSSYKTFGEKSHPKITESFEANITNRSILLVDDVSDTGDSLYYAKKFLSRRKPKHITTATIHVKKHTKFVPDFFIETNNDWILYPAEITETIHTLAQKWTREGKSPAIISKKLEGLKLPKFFIRAFLL